ncbi:MAG: hypothetical protein ACLFN8_03025 [Candidatus Woesearchaeota archaeon]
MQKFFLNKNEKKILLELVKNPITTDTTLSKKIKISITATQNIRKKLEQTIIKKYTLSINPIALNFEFYVLFLFTANENRIKKIRQSKLHSHIMENSLCEFKVIDPIINRVIIKPFKNINEYHEFLIKTDEEYNDAIDLKEILFLPLKNCTKYSKKHIYQNSILNNDFETSKNQKYEKNTIKEYTNKPISKNEQIVLKELALNPRTKLMTMSKKLDLSITGISKIINRLTKEGLINSFEIILDENLMNLTIGCLFLAHIKKLSDKKNILLEFLQTSGNVYRVFEISNTKHNIAFFTRFKSINEVTKFIEHINLNYSNSCQLKSSFIFSNSQIIKPIDENFFIKQIN